MHGVREYGVDCVFVRVGFRENTVGVDKSSVLNLELTAIWKEIQKVLKEDTQELTIGTYKITKI